MWHRPLPLENSPYCRYAPKRCTTRRRMGSARRPRCGCSVMDSKRPANRVTQRECGAREEVVNADQGHESSLGYIAGEAVPQAALLAAPHVGGGPVTDR